MAGSFVLIRRSWSFRENRLFELSRQAVRRVEIIERDSAVDGAILGGAFVAACARWWCGDESTTNRGKILAAGLVGASLWGWSLTAGIPPNTSSLRRAIHSPAGLAPPSL